MRDVLALLAELPADLGATLLGCWREELLVIVGSFRDARDIT